MHITEIDLSAGLPKRSSDLKGTYFFIVDNIKDGDFANELALEFQENGAWYHFFGKHEPTWHFEFDRAFVETHPELKDDEIIATLGYDDLDDFVDEIYLAIIYGNREVFLFYDDPDILKKTKNALKNIKNE